uniref:Uncharacterized protein n=1 Tax=Caenorhabditis japonica TaxID=281687 RepID=A0A8R1IY22_CAEJA
MRKTKVGPGPFAQIDEEIAARRRREEAEQREREERSRREDEQLRRDAERRKREQEPKTPPILPDGYSGFHGIDRFELDAEVSPEDIPRQFNNVSLSQLDLKAGLKVGVKMANAMGMYRQAEQPSDSSDSNGFGDLPSGASSVGPLPLVVYSVPPGMEAKIEAPAPKSSKICSIM